MDRIVFVMAGNDERRFHKSVPDGEGERVFRDLIEAGSRWIEVDDLHWVLRDQVRYAYVDRELRGS